jgi:hypothetical protein
LGKHFGTVRFGGPFLFQGQPYAASGNATLSTEAGTPASRGIV